VWETIAAAATGQSALWESCLRAEGERDAAAVFSTLAPPEHRLGLETIYEGYLVHYGRPRLFAPGDRDTVLLLGDYLYAQGLVRLSAAGSVEAVADMGELISLCAQLRAESSPDDGPPWAASVALLGRGVLKETEDGKELLARARDAAGDEAVERSLAAHARRVG